MIIPLYPMRYQVKFCYLSDKEQKHIHVAYGQVPNKDLYSDLNEAYQISHGLHMKYGHIMTFWVSEYRFGDHSYELGFEGSVQ